MSVQHSATRPSAGRLPESDVAWKAEVYLALCKLIGPQKGDQILWNFRQSLPNRLADPNDGESLRRDAHSLCSTSGMLGFEQLSERARELEQICDEGASTPEAYAALKAAVRGAEWIIDEFLTSSSRESSPVHSRAGDQAPK